MPILTTAQVITFGDGRLACTMDQVYQGLNALLDENLMTHQLPRAGDFVEPHVIESCPWVKDLPDMPPVEGLTRDLKGYAIDSWVAKISAQHGELHEVPDLSGLWIHLNPIDEIHAMVGNGEAEVVIIEIVEDDKE